MGQAISNGIINSDTEFDFKIRATHQICRMELSVEALEKFNTTVKPLQTKELETLFNGIQVEVALNMELQKKLKNMDNGIDLIIYNKGLK